MNKKLLERINYTIGFVVTLAIGIIIAPWFFKAVLIFFDVLGKWYMDYFEWVIYLGKVRP